MISYSGDETGTGIGTKADIGSRTGTCAESGLGTGTKSGPRGKLIAQLGAGVGSAIGASGSETEPINDCVKLMKRPKI